METVRRPRASAGRRQDRAAKGVLAPSGGVAQDVVSQCPCSETWRGETLASLPLSPQLTSFLHKDELYVAWLGFSRVIPCSFST